MEALQQGTVQMIAPSFPNMSQLSPSWMVLDLPFAFLTHEAANNGFKQLTSNKEPIIHPADLAGQHLRTMRSRLLEAEFQANIPLPVLAVYHYLTSEVDSLDLAA